MDIKDSYLHGTVGVVKSISVAADKLSYKLADVAGTTKTVTLPLATQSANGLLSKEDKTKLDNMIATKVANDLILKIDSGTTEGTSLYTYNGSTAKTLDIKSGTGIAFSKTAGALQIFNSGVRSIATGTTNGTISVNTNGTAADVAVKGLGSAAYTASTDYLNLKTYVSPSSDSWYYKKITVTKNTTYGYGIWLHSRQQHFLANSGLALGTSYMLKLYELGTNINGTDTSRSMSVKMVATYSSSDVTFYVKIQGYNYLQVVSSGTITILDSTQSEYDGITSSTEGWIPCTYAKWTDTTYNVVSNSDNGLAPKVINTNTTTIGSAYYVLASTNGSATPSWYKLPTNAFSNTTYTFTNGTSGNFTVTPSGGTAQTVSIGKPATAGTADAAVKLQTKRKLWGLDFDGTADVSGNMIGVGTINNICNIQQSASGVAIFNIIETSADINYTHLYVSSGNTTATKTRPLVLQNGYGNVGIGVIAPTQKLEVNGNVKATLFLGNLDGTYVNKLTGYTKATSASALAATDTLNAALGKLEYKAHYAYDWVIGVTKTDTDEYINKWSEIVGFLDSVKEGTDILDEFVTRKTTQTITGSKTFTASTNTFSGTGATILTIDRNSTNPAWIRFCKNGTLLGYIGIDNSYNPTYLSGKSGAAQKIILHSGNYTSYLPILNSASTHATNTSVIYAPTTAGTKGLILTSNGSGAPVWSNSVGTANNGVFYIEGTGTTAGTWLGSHTGITSYYVGLTIAYKIPIAGASTTTLNINSLGAKTCYINTSKLTTHYGVGCVAILVYDGTYFRAADYWDGNSYAYVRQYTTDSTNSEYPLLFRYNTAAPTANGYVTEYTRYDSGITINPSTNTITATLFKGSLKPFHVTTANYGESINYESLLLQTIGSTVSGNSGYAGDNYGFPVSNNANGILWLGVHSLGYGGLLGVSSNSKLYYRFIGSKSYPTTANGGSWKEIAFTNSNITGNAASATTIAIGTASGNVNYPVLFTTSTSSSNTASVYIDADSKITFNPRTNTLTCTNFEGTVSNVSGVAGTDNVSRHIWFSHSTTETRRSWDNDFMYNPSTNILTVGSITGSAGKLTATTIVSSKAFSLSNASWIDTGYTFASLASGTYAIQVTCGTLVASGIMSVYKNVTDTAGDEIPLHVYHDSTQPWRPYLRTSANKLLISSNDGSATSRTVTIKIALIL